MPNGSVLWKRLDTPGHESARIYMENSVWHLAGTAVFSHKGEPCRLDYLILCDSGWRTLSARVGGWVGDDPITLAVLVDSEGRWRLNDHVCPHVEGCTDVDLNFSPSTNLLPIRRLELAIGQEAAVRAAWLRFPSFTLEPLDQIYRRIGEDTYRYESGGGTFVSELRVDEEGFVTDYAGIWRKEA
jgi:hypothetical protein